MSLVQSDLGRGQQLGFEAGGPWSDGAVGKLSLQTRSDFLWSVDASLALGSGRTGWYGFRYRIECFSKKLYPASDMRDWTARYNTIKKLADDIVKEFRKKAPVQANQTLLTRLQQLESENARWKGQASGSSRQAPKTSQAGAKTSQRKGGPKQVVAPVTTPPPEDAPEEGSQEDARTADFGTPPHLQDIFPPSDEEIEPDSGPIAADDTYEQYLPKPGVTLFLESCSLDSHTLRGVNSWLASTALGKGKNKAIDTAASEFVAACSKLDDDGAVEWGLAVSVAAKLNEKSLIRLIAGAHLLATQ